jgi:hypothetical protein
MKEKLKRYIELLKETKHYLLNPLGIHYLLEDVRLSGVHAHEYWKLYIGKVEDTPAYQAMAKETAARKAAMDEMEQQFEADLDDLRAQLAEAYATNAQLCSDRASAIAEAAYLRAERG